MRLVSNCFAARPPVLGGRDASSIARTRFPARSSITLLIRHQLHSVVFIHVLQGCVLLIAESNVAEKDTPNAVREFHDRIHAIELCILPAMESCKGFLNQQDASASVRSRLPYLSAGLPPAQAPYPRRPQGAETAPLGYSADTRLQGGARTLFVARQLRVYLSAVPCLSPSSGASGNPRHSQ